MTYTAPYAVTVTYDPPCHRGYRWAYTIYDTNGDYVWSDVVSSQGVAERNARRRIRRLTRPGGYSYSFTLGGA